MKKYYGPIVLGIIALTLAAPISNATTVLADELSSSESSTEPEVPAEDTKGDNNEEGIQPGTTDPTDNAYKGTIDLVFQRDDPSYPVKENGVELTFSKLDTYENKTLKLDHYAYFDGKGFIATDKDGKTISDTHTVIPMKIDKDGNITIDPDYINENDQIRGKYELTVEGVKSQIDTFINKDFPTTYLDIYSSSDQEKFNEVYQNLSAELKDENSKLNDDMTLDELKNVEDEVVKTVRTYTTMIDIRTTRTDDFVDKDNKYSPEDVKVINSGKLYPRAIKFIPIVKGAEVYFPNYTGKNRDEYLGITFNEDGTKIEKAEITDSNKKRIKTNTQTTVWMTNFITSAIPDYAVTTENQPVNNTNHSSSSHHHTSTNNNKPAEIITNNKVVESVENVTFLTTPYTDTTLFDDNGNKIPNVSLKDNSSWKVDKFMTLNNVKYGRVATNEWVKMSNGLSITPNKAVVRTQNKITGLVDANGKKVTNRALAGNTPWYSDMTAEINGQIMYRVSNTEWVPASDVNQTNN